MALCVVNYLPRIFSAPLYKHPWPMSSSSRNAVGVSSAVCVFMLQRPSFLPLICAGQQFLCLIADKSIQRRS